MHHCVPLHITLTISVFTHLLPSDVSPRTQLGFLNKYNLYFLQGCYLRIELGAYLSFTQQPSRKSGLSRLFVNLCH
jgi:hypothetical protein